MAKQKNIIHTMLRNIDLAHQRGRGHSKRADRQTGVSAFRVYADTTARNCVKICRRFGRWVRREHPEAWTDMEEARTLVPAYLMTISNPGSRATVANGLAKGFNAGTGKAWGVKNGKRHLTQITRGRQLTSRAHPWCVYVSRTAGR